jgi:bifunctional UDP-N-acetylglucosamine pyrophosphorylase/glucosamine-1-phosphate N-acetyltransferase
VGDSEPTAGRRRDPVTAYAIILAGGQGTRMRSATAKVLHRVAGKPMVRHVVDALAEAFPRGGPRLYVVVGHQAEAVAAAVPEAVPVLQSPQRGTGHAVAVALSALPPGSDDVVLVLNGDMPLVRPATIRRIREALAPGVGAALLTAQLPDPHGYGRIVRDAAGRLCRVVEEADATAEERRLAEVNVGLFAFDRRALSEALTGIGDANAQGERYLPDVLPRIQARGLEVRTVGAEDPVEALGVNDRYALSRVARLLSDRRVAAACRDGRLTVADAQSAWLDTTVRLGEGVVLGPGSVVTGEAILSDRARLCRATVEGYTVAAGAIVGPGCLLLRARSGQEAGTIASNSVTGRPRSGKGGR